MRLILNFSLFIRFGCGCRFDKFGMDLDGKILDMAAELAREFSQFGILAKKFLYLGHLSQGQGLALVAGRRESLAVLSIGIRESLVPIGLPGLGQQDEWCGIGGLKTEGQVEKDEGIGIEFEQSEGIGKNPSKYCDALKNQKDGRAEKPGEPLGLESKPIASEGLGVVKMRKMKPQMMLIVNFDGDWSWRGITHQNHLSPFQVPWMREEIGGVP